MMNTKIYNQELSEVCLGVDNGDLQKAFKVAVKLPTDTDNRTAIKAQLLQLIFAGDKKVAKTFLDKIYLMDYQI